MSDTRSPLRLGGRMPGIFLALFGERAPRLPKEMEFFVTLWPDFPHFDKFAGETRLSGIRLNSAMIDLPELDRGLDIIRARAAVALYFDIKGRQLRVTQVHEDPENLIISLNHPVAVATPAAVLFKAGSDGAVLDRIEENGHRLVFRGVPRYTVNPGESLQIRHPSLRVGGKQFTPLELEKLERVKQAGFTHYFLSYVQSQRDVDEFRELVGRDSQIMLKIEDQAGLEYVAREFKKDDQLRLVAAQGDLYVEVARPYDILSALKLIIEHDPEANVASRMMLSIDDERRMLLSMDGQPVPSCADFQQIAWLYDIGYRSFMLCDEICLKDELLSPALNALYAFKDNYAH